MRGGGKPEVSKDGGGGVGYLSGARAYASVPQTVAGSIVAFCSLAMARVATTRSELADSPLGLASLFTGE